MLLQEIAGPTRGADALTTLLFASTLRTLLIANAITLVFAAAFSWTVADLAGVYWLEMCLIGVVVIGQMRRAAVRGTLAKSRGYLTVFFVAHYGTYCVMYRAALVPVLNTERASPVVYWVTALCALAALGVAHYGSYRDDFLPREAAGTSSFSAMWIPYLRGLPVQLPLLLAVRLAPTEHRAAWIVITIGLGKTAIDAVTHVVYHSRAAQRSAAA